MSIDSPAGELVWLRPAPEPGSSISCDQESFTVAGADVIVLFLTGEIDMHTNPIAHDALTRLADDLSAHVVVDLTGLRFCSISGFRMLIDTARAIDADGRRFVLVARSAQVTRVWALLWPDHHIARHTTVTAAVTAIRIG